MTPFIMRPRHAFLVRDLSAIEPLGTPASEGWLLDGTVGARTRAILGEAGLTIQPVDSVEEAVEKARATPEGAVVVLDSVVFSRRVLRELLAAFAAGSRKAITAALPEALATRRLAHVSGLESVVIDGVAAWTAPLHVLAPGATLADAEPVLLPYKEHVIKFPTPVGMIGKSEASFGATDAVLVRVVHWTHLMRVNLSVFLASWIERWQNPLGRLWFIWRALCGFPWRRGRLAGSLRRIHRKAQVHHTAVVELSVIEEGATVGANAVVKNSWIGKGARVDDGANVNSCVIGAGAMVASSSAMFSSVLCPGSFGAQLKMQFSMLGENSVAFTGSFFYDLNFDRNVRVKHGDAFVDGGDRFLGVCLGPWARIAGGVWIGSGRQIPARALLIQPPDRVLTRVDAELAAARMITIVDGKAVDAGPLPSGS